MRVSSSTTATAPVRPKRILVVEDNYDNRMIYVTVLEHWGYEVTEAVNGEEGVARARETRPDLILMDLAMPTMSGWEALHELRCDETLRKIPVLALSAHVLLEGDFERAIAAGFTDYLTKPIEPKQVLEAVRRALGSDPDASPPP